MSTDERSTHFQGFAKLLWEDIKDVLPDKVLAALFDANEIYDVETCAIQVIAQRAYDLARHAIDCTAGGYYASHYLALGDDMADVLDMTEWPKQEE